MQKLPNYRDHRIYLVHLLRVLRQSGPSKPAEIYDKVADRAGITAEQRSVDGGSAGGNPVYRHRIQFARQSLIDAGLLIGSAEQGWAYGIWELNPQGRELADETKSDVQLQALLLEKAAYGARARKQTRDASRDLAGISISDPQQVIQEVPVQSIEDDSLDLPSIKNLVDEANEVALSAILENVRAMNDTAFEHLVAAVLKSALNADSATVTQRSRDGGIDGVLSFDSLGMRIAVFEAKRYAADNAVSRTQIDAFATAARRMNAAHSLFVTSSYFSSEAKSAAKDEGIRLVEGTVLVELMARHGFGLRPKETYVVYEMDPTWSIAGNADSA